MQPNIRRFMSAAVAASCALTLAGTPSVEAQTPALNWGPAPDAFPPGAKIAIEQGDPTKSGIFVVRLSMPDGYKVPPHWHPTDEHVRVVSGAFLVGMGDVLDASKTMKLAPNDTGTIKATMHHFAIAQGPTEVSVRAEGPFVMTYVNPADDPRKKN